MPQMDCLAGAGALPSSCLAQQGAVNYDNGDSIAVTYTAVTVEGATDLEMRACFSDIDTIGRPWRAVGADYAVSLLLCQLQTIDAICAFLLPGHCLVCG